jgi:Sel1 repeat.
MYDKGDGVEQNKLLANKYFKQSCERGFEKACNKLEK